MTIGYPDYQDYAQWLGPVLDSGTGVAVPVPNLQLGPYTITNYAQIVVGIAAGNAPLTVFVSQTRAAAPATVVAGGSWLLKAGQTDVHPVSLVGDTIALKLTPGTDGSVIDFGVWGSNSLEPVQTPAGDLSTPFGLAAVLPYYFTGLGYGRVRTPALFHTRATAQVVAGTPAALWTPVISERFRLLAGELSLSVAGQIILRDGATEFLRSPQLGAGSTWSLPPLGNGYLSNTVNAVLSVDVSATGNVGGWVGGTEE